MDNDQSTTQDPTAAAPSTPATQELPPIVPTANVSTSGVQPEGTTLDTRPAAAEKAAVNTLGVSVGDRIATVDKAGASLIAAVVPVADLQRLIELAQQVHHFVANEGSPIVKELMIVAADVGQYL